MHPAVIATLCAASLATSVRGQDDAGRTADIRWTEGLAAAMAASAKDGRPVIAYFTFET